jgi:hypothetical protein
MRHLIGGFDQAFKTERSELPGFIVVFVVFFIALRLIFQLNLVSRGFIKVLTESVNREAG